MKASLPPSVRNLLRRQKRLLRRLLSVAYAVKVYCTSSLSLSPPVTLFSILDLSVNDFFLFPFLFQEPLYFIFWSFYLDAWRILVSIEITLLKSMPSYFPFSWLFYGLHIILISESENSFIRILSQWRSHFLLENSKKYHWMKLRASFFLSHLSSGYTQSPSPIATYWTPQDSRFG